MHTCEREALEAGMPDVETRIINTIRLHEGASPKTRSTCVVLEPKILILLQREFAKCDRHVRERSSKRMTATYAQIARHENSSRTSGVARFLHGHGKTMRRRQQVCGMVKRSMRELFTLVRRNMNSRRACVNRFRRIFRVNSSMREFNAQKKH